MAAKREQLLPQFIETNTKLPPGELEELMLKVF